MSAIHAVVERTNWALLKDQKLAFLETMQVVENDEKEARAHGRLAESEALKERLLHLEGILNWMDEIQDAAEKEGCPVEWLTEGDDE